MPIFSRSPGLCLATAAGLLGAGLLAAAGAPAATSPEQTRATYAAAVEPICQADAAADRRILAGVNGEIGRGELARAGARYERSAAAFERAARRIAAVPQPPADAARLSTWLRRLGVQRALLERIGTTLRAGQRGQAQALFVRLSHNGTLANNAVLGFDFHHCLFESSRFG